MLWFKFNIEDLDCIGIKFEIKNNEYIYTTIECVRRLTTVSNPF